MPWDIEDAEKQVAKLRSGTDWTRTLTTRSPYLGAGDTWRDLSHVWPMRTITQHPEILELPVESIIFDDPDTPMQVVET